MSRLKIFTWGFLLTAIFALGTWKVLRHCGSCGVQPTQSESQNWEHMLGLDESQKARIDPLLVQFKKDMGEYETKLASCQISLCKILMNPESADQKNIKACLAEASQLRQAKDERMASHLIAVRDLLRPDQQKVFFSTMMKDICVHCRQSTGSQIDHCQMCKS